MPYEFDRRRCIALAGQAVVGIAAAPLVLGAAEKAAAPAPPIAKST